MKAKDARKLALQNGAELVKSILKKIKDAATKGELSLKVATIEIPDSVRTILKNDGYLMVGIQEDGYDKYKVPITSIMISW